MTEMICTSADGRITPGCGGLYRDEHIAAWKRIVDFVHPSRARRSAASSGTPGARARRKLLWEGEDVPLDDGNWPLIAPSPLPYVEGVNQVPREMTRADMDDVRDEFVAADAARGRGGLRPARAPHGARLPALELFLSPLTNVRDDEYGADRGEFPLEVFAACREVWPARQADVGAHQRDRLGRGWLRRRRRGGVRAPARRQPAATSSTSRPARSRPTSSLPTGARFQTPYADRIRHEAGIPVIAVGRDLVLRRREHDHPRRARRPLRAGPAAPVGPALDAARGRRPGRRRARGRRSTGRARASRRPARTCAACRCGASTRRCRA